MARALSAEPWASCHALRAASSWTGSTRISRLRIADRLGGRYWASRRRTRKRCRGCARPRPSWRRGRRCPEELGVDERLRQEHFVTEAGRPVPHQTARAQREHARAEVALTAGENQKTRVVGDQVKTAELNASVPADPVITRPTLQRRCREHRQRQPAPSMVRDIAHGLAHPRHRAEVVVCLHQVAEAGLVLRRNDVDGHLAKNHHGFPAPRLPRATHIRTRGRSPLSQATPWQGWRKVEVQIRPGVRGERPCNRDAGAYHARRHESCRTNDEAATTTTVCRGAAASV